MLNNNIRPRQATLRQHLIILPNINQSRACWSLRSTSIPRHAIGKRHGPKVRKRHQLAILLEILHDPLSILAAQLTGAGDCFGDRLARGEVLDCCRAGSRGSGFHGYGDAVTCGEGDAGEIIGVIWVPFIPCIVGSTAIGDGEVDTCLQDGVCVCVAVDADPSGSGSTTRWGGHDEICRNGVEGRAGGRSGQDCTRPVRAVLYVCLVVRQDAVNGAGCRYLRVRESAAGGCAAFHAFSDTSEGSAEKKNIAEDDEGVLHHELMAESWKTRRKWYLEVEQGTEDN